MLKHAQKKLSSNKNYRIEFIRPSPTHELRLEEKPDVITAIQCHHYLSREDQKKPLMCVIKF